MENLQHCAVEGCTCDTAHHHLDEGDGRATPCAGKVNDYDEYERTCCQPGPRYLPNPCGHTQAIAEAAREYVRGVGAWESGTHLYPNAAEDALYAAVEAERLDALKEKGGQPWPPRRR